MSTSTLVPSAYYGLQSISVSSTSGIRSRLSNVFRRVLKHNGRLYTVNYEYDCTDHDSDIATLLQDTDEAQLMDAEDSAWGAPPCPYCNLLSKWRKSLGSSIVFRRCKSKQSRRISSEEWFRLEAYPTTYY